MGLPRHAGGDPVWIFRDSSYASAGFATTQAELAGDLMISLDGVDGPDGGHFSMYSGSTPDVHMTTINGIDPSDVFAKPPQHTHVNWAFTHKGLWIVRLRAMGIIASSGDVTPISPAASLVFAIGEHARWKTMHFSLAELSDPAVSGDDADPDGDGWSNLMEYALGGDCRTASELREDDALPLAPRLLAPATIGAPWRLCYFRRPAGSNVDVSYTVESCSSLDPPSWSPETGAEELQSSPTGWELVCVPLTSGKTRFFRLKVTAMP
jgi:hypothetical protein